MQLLYTALAEADLDHVATYTRERWGEAQCTRYIQAIGNCCQSLADGALTGRIHGGSKRGNAPLVFGLVERIRRNDQVYSRFESGKQVYSRFESGKHVIFFRRITKAEVWLSYGIGSCTDALLIVRILHERMLPELHLGG